MPGDRNVRRRRDCHRIDSALSTILSLSEFRLRHHLTKTAWSELLEMLPVIAACKEICKIDSPYKYLIRGPDKRKKDGAILSPTDDFLVQGDGR